ncbi:MAG TPA: phospholipase A2 [Actinomycetota bacterium]|nr:phospholipase A2 [Actinomycetota bacterium]
MTTTLVLGPGTASATNEPGVQATPFNEGGEWWLTAESDYCTVVPEAGVVPPTIGPPAWFNFGHACLHHDGCYQHHWAERATCDQWFLNDMTASCAALHGWYTPNFATCYELALVYFAGVRALGDPFYDQHSAATPMSTYG